MENWDREVELTCLNCGKQFDGFYDPDNEECECPKCGSTDVEMN